ncbi:MAG TPA: CinA family nicotinamide mononucleotide deamidase-related protein [Dehalococcoidia bacterium]|nr:CinA family nicotinamide mononucleotide deamidase-related protein [Dehalococcoidia bacterium]
MKAEIISIGTELLLGEIVDTNTSFLASQLSVLGIDLYFTSAVGDNPARLQGVLKQAWDRSDIIFTTGGLGPTQDDLTRDAIAALLGEELKVAPQLKQELINFFARRGLEMPASNVRQATLIPSSTALVNPQGTAPGWWVEKEGKIIVSMPGPPGEMQYMWENQVLPRLQKRAGAAILTRMIKTFGTSEAKVDEMLADLTPSPNPTLATYAKLDGIYIRIAAKAETEEEAREMIARREADVRAILGDIIWGVDDDSQEGVAGRMLLEEGLSLAVAESFTGGFLTHMLGTAADSERYFKGGLVAATSEVKIALGLDPNLANSEDKAEVARAMAVLARQKMGATVGIGIEGESGVEPESGMVPGTVFIAIDSEKADLHTVRSYSGRLYQMKRRAAYYALFDLVKLLKE